MIAGAIALGVGIGRIDRIGELDFLSVSLCLIGIALLILEFKIRIK